MKENQGEKAVNCKVLKRKIEKHKQNERNSEILERKK